MALVYLLTNLVNGKLYVGKTKMALDKRFWNHVYKSKRGSPYAIHAAIRKHGQRSFIREVLGDYATEEEALLAEREWIEKLGTRDRKRGYNMCEGGRGALGYRHTDEMRAKLSALAIAKGRAPSALALQRSANLRRGKPISNDTKAAMREAHATWRAERPPTESFREKCRASAAARFAAGPVPRIQSQAEIAKRSASSKASAPKRWATRIANAEPNGAPRLSIGEAAKRIGRSVAVLCKWDRNGLLRARRTATGARYYDVTELEAALQTLTFPKAGRPPTPKD